MLIENSAYVLSESAFLRCNNAKCTAFLNCYSIFLSLNNEVLNPT